MKRGDKLKINDVAKLTGITVRTLHYYDEIGLLKPSKITDAGYRIYDEDNLEAINDLSEDMRQEIDTIYQAIAALSIKEPKQEEPRRKIGFKTGADS